jgi:hypothetical protein
VTTIVQTGNQFRVIHQNPEGEMPSAFFGKPLSSLEAAKAQAEQSWARGRKVRRDVQTHANNPSIWTMYLAE